VDKYILIDEESDVFFTFECEIYQVETKVAELLEEDGSVECCEDYKLYKVTEQFSITLTTKLNKI
jgi:hypothetical protein